MAGSKYSQNDATNDDRARLRRGKGRPRSGRTRYRAAELPCWSVADRTSMRRAQVMSRVYVQQHVRMLLEIGLVYFCSKYSREIDDEEKKIQRCNINLLN